MRLQVAEKKSLTVVCANAQNSSLECAAFLKSLGVSWKGHRLGILQLCWGTSTLMCATSGRNGLPNLNLSGVLLLDLLVINWP